MPTGVEFDGGLAPSLGGSFGNPSARSCSPSPSALDQILQLPIISVLPVVIRVAARTRNSTSPSMRNQSTSRDPTSDITSLNSMTFRPGRGPQNSLGQTVMQAGQERLYERKHGGVHIELCGGPAVSDGAPIISTNIPVQAATAGRILRFPLIRPCPLDGARTASCF